MRPEVRTVFSLSTFDDKFTLTRLLILSNFRLKYRGSEPNVAWFDIKVIL